MENVKIQRFGANGEGIAILDGKVTFVPNAMKNEQCLIKIKKCNKNYNIAELMEIIIPSNNRVKPICPYYEMCGGCDIMHMNYVTQLDIKTQIVNDTVSKITGKKIKVNSCQPCYNQLYYRNKATFFISNKGKLGYFKKGSHEIVEIDKCFITQNEINETIKIFNNFFANNIGEVYDWKTKKGNIKCLEIRYNQNQFLFTLVCKYNNIKNINKLIENIEKRNINCGIFICENPSNTSVISGKLKHIYGLEFISFEEQNLKTSQLPLSFVQINNQIKERMYNYIINKVEGKTVVDAYCGRGVMTARIAQKAKYVYGIEIEKQSCIDAENIFKNNNINNAEIICGDCEKMFPTLADKQIDFVVFDPPRNGCGEEFLNQLKQCKVKKMIYVSCNPATLARDVKILDDCYDVEEITPFDMFPQTNNVECVAEFTLKDTYEKI